jgi:hypothetical protein
MLEKSLIGGRHLMTKRRLVYAFCVVLAAIVLCVIAAPWPSGRQGKGYPPDCKYRMAYCNTNMLFVARAPETDDWEIYPLEWLTGSDVGPMDISSDGRRLVYSADAWGSRAARSVCVEIGSSDTATRKSVDGPRCGTLSFSKAGDKVAMAGAGALPYPLHLYVWDLGTGKIRQAADAIGNDESFASPPLSWIDDRHIVVEMPSESIESVDTSGTDPRTRITAGCSPYVSPDGKHMIFTRGKSMFLMDLATRGETKLTDVYAGHDEAAWSPDSAFLVYTRESHAFLTGFDVIVMRLSDRKEYFVHHLGYIVDVGNVKLRFVDDETLSRLRAPAPRKQGDRR